MDFRPFTGIVVNLFKQTVPITASFLYGCLPGIKRKTGCCYTSFFLPGLAVRTRIANGVIPFGHRVTFFPGFPAGFTAVIVSHLYFLGSVGGRMFGKALRTVDSVRDL